MVQKKSDKDDDSAVRVIQTALSEMERRIEVRLEEMDKRDVLRSDALRIEIDGRVKLLTASQASFVTRDQHETLRLYVDAGDSRGREITESKIEASDIKSESRYDLISREVRTLEAVKNRAYGALWLACTISALLSAILSIFASHFVGLK